MYYFVLFTFFLVFFLLSCSDLFCLYFLFFSEDRSYKPRCNFRQQILQQQKIAPSFWCPENLDFPKPLPPCWLLRKLSFPRTLRSPTPRSVAECTRWSAPPVLPPATTERRRQDRRSLYMAAHPLRAFRSRWRREAG